MGGGKTRKIAPFQDASWDIWAFSSKRFDYPRVSRWFEIHAMTDLKQQLAPKKRRRRSFPNYMQYMRSLPCPVYMARVHPSIPNSVAFPKDKLVKEFGHCFTSTASFLIALAIVEGYDVIGLWGVNPSGTSYNRQRPAIKYLLGLARQRGIRLVFPHPFDIDIPRNPTFVKTDVLYAYGWRSSGAWWRDRVRKRMRKKSGRLR